MNKFISPEQAAAWLGGIIDGEGHVRHGLTQVGTKTKNRYKCITITNTDQSILDACQEALELLSIDWKRHMKPINKYGQCKDGSFRKPCFVIWIMGRENLIKINELVPIRSIQKKEALETAIASYVTDPIEKGRRISEGRRLGKEKRLALGLPLRQKKYSNG